MKFRVERCWSGNHNYSFRVSNKTTALRFHVTGEEWTRDLARQALDTIERSQACLRRNVRFHHH